MLKLATRIGRACRTQGHSTRVGIVLAQLLNLCHNLFHIILKHQNLLINFDLSSKVGDHDLELGVTIIEESLVVLDLLVHEEILFIESLQVVDAFDQPPTMISYLFLLVVTGVILELGEKAHRLVELALQIGISSYLTKFIFGQERSLLPRFVILLVAFEG